MYVAAIAAHHDAVYGKSLGKHELVVRFLRGARRLNPPRPTSVPSWDLSLVLMALQRPPFGPLQSAELKILSLKTVLLRALEERALEGNCEERALEGAYKERARGGHCRGAGSRAGLQHIPSVMPAGLTSLRMVAGMTSESIA